CTEALTPSRVLRAGMAEVLRGWIDGPGDWVRRTPCRSPDHRTNRVRTPWGTGKKAGQTGFPIRPDLDHKRAETPRLCVPETSGTGGAPATRQDPCLAKTRHFLHLISRFRCRPDRLGSGESDIMKASRRGCKGCVGPRGPAGAAPPAVLRRAPAGGRRPGAFPAQRRGGPPGGAPTPPARAGAAPPWWASPPRPRRRVRPPGRPASRPGRRTPPGGLPCAAAGAPSRRRRQPPRRGGVRAYLMIFDTTPAPTVRPPSRIAKRRPSSIAIGLISDTDIFTLSPGITISVPSGSVTAPVMSVVRK